MQIFWTPLLKFSNEELYAKAQKMSFKAMHNGELSMRQKWLGSYYSQEIETGFIPEVSVEWIDEKIGYGVYARKSFAVGAFLGEYTGLVRPRKRRLDRKNDYCFEYAVGMKSPWVIDAKECGNHTRFINHSAKPNIEPMALYSKGLMHIVFISVQPIKKGDQLFYEYGPYFWKKRRDLIEITC